LFLVIKSQQSGDLARSLAGLDHVAFIP
jgi:hypothetical protein